MKVAASKERVKMYEIKNLGVKITEDLRWNIHISNMCTKANRTFGFLRRNLYSCPQDVKEAAYKGLVGHDSSVILHSVS